MRAAVVLGGDEVRVLDDAEERQRPVADVRPVVGAERPVEHEDDEHRREIHLVREHRQVVGGQVGRDAREHVRRHGREHLVVVAALRLPAPDAHVEPARAPVLDDDLPHAGGDVHLAPLLADAVAERVEYLAERPRRIGELLLELAGEPLAARGRAERELVPQPRHCDAVVVTPKLAAQHRLEDRVVDAAAAMREQPFGGGLLFERGPLLAPLESEREQAEPDAVGERQRAEPQQVERRREPPQAPVGVVADVRVDPAQPVREAELADEVDHRRVAAEQVVVPPFERDAVHGERRRLPAEEGRALEDLRAVAPEPELVGGGESRRAAADDADLHSRSPAAPAARPRVSSPSEMRRAARCSSPAAITGSSSATCSTTA